MESYSEALKNKNVESQEKSEICGGLSSPERPYSNLKIEKAVWNQTFENGIGQPEASGNISSFLICFVTISA